MRWSWRIGSLAGIQIFLHYTFPLLLLWGGWLQFSVQRSWIDAGVGVAFAAALCVLVLLHEFGHAFAAKRYGIRTRDITLLPIGGVARIERIPENAKQELVVALAGPAVNVCLAILLTGMLVEAWPFFGMIPYESIASAIMLNLVIVNVCLAVFNLVPAFPMDGGRVLRALLSLRLGRTCATAIAARLGQLLAIVFAILAVAYFHQPLWLMLAVFVFIGAARELQMVRVKASLAGLSVGDLMQIGSKTLAPTDNLSDAMNYAVLSRQRDFAVVEDDQVVGVVTQRALFSGAAMSGTDVQVRDVMYPDFPVTEPEEALEGVFLRMRNEGWPMLPVMKEGRLLGVLPGEAIREFLQPHNSPNPNGPA
jgi:Zn-dependent protease/CBS domain-containing protein